ncbi:MAG: hypothetical protein C0625_04325 [Arcobacter sp.]|nr:MAG: hypothetical protein C0625_04325 [Arcobacter sp.]
MFKQVKSAFFWYYLYKFRKKVLIIAFLILIALFANAIYGDVVQYLTLKEKLEYLEIALLTKWIIIIFNLLFSIYLILTIFRIDKEKDFSENTDKNKKNNDIVNPKKKNNSPKFTKREEEFLNKDLLKNRADSLVER